MAHASFALAFMALLARLTAAIGAGANRLSRATRRRSRRPATLRAAAGRRSRSWRSSARGGHAQGRRARSCRRVGALPGTAAIRPLAFDSAQCRRSRRCAKAGATSHSWRRRRSGSGSSISRPPSWKWTMTLIVAGASHDRAASRTPTSPGARIVVYRDARPIDEMRAEVADQERRIVTVPIFGYKQAFEMLARPDEADALRRSARRS